MGEFGWTFDAERAAWVLLDRYGLDAGTVTLEVLNGCGTVMVNRAGARKGWPELVPGSPWWHLVLAGGPLDGLHQYLDPAACDDPPGELTAYVQEIVLAAVPGQAEPEPAGEVSRPVTYRRQIQVCGHGRACPYPYTHDRGLW